MPEEVLIERADRAIAESKRLVDRLREAIWQAQRLNRNLQYQHWLRLESEAKWHRPNRTMGTPNSQRVKHDDCATELPIAGRFDG